MFMTIFDFKMRHLQFWYLFGILLAVIVMPVNAQPNQKDISCFSGSWFGTVKLVGQTFITRVYITVEDGKVRGELDDLTSSKLRLPLKNIQIDYPSITFEINPPMEMTAKFTGTLYGNTLKGTVKQFIFRGPFEFTNVSVPNSTQGEEEFILRTDTGILYGTLAIPDVQGVCPVALLISGSGPTDRNGNSLFLKGQNNSLKLLSEELRKIGIASLRFDKRGIGKSFGALSLESDLRFEDLVEDVHGWIRKLQEDPRFTSIILIGHSQGALIAMLAAKHSNISALILLAGQGHPIDEILLKQISDQFPSMVDEAQNIISQLKAGRVVPKVSHSLQPIFRPSVQHFLQSWFAYNPQTIIQSISCPILLVYGSNDLQAGVNEGKLLLQAQTQAKLLIINGMNHVLKQVPDSKEKNLKSYEDQSLPISTKLIEGIRLFLLHVL